MLSPNGAPISVTNVTSKQYPETAREMKKFYLPSVSTNNVSGLNTPGQAVFNIKTAADKENDSTAVQGLAKLNLFNFGAYISILENGIIPIKF